MRVLRALVACGVLLSNPPLAAAQVELRGTFIDYLRVNSNGALVDPTMRRSMRYTEDGTTYSCDVFGPGAVATTLVATTAAGITMRGTSSHSASGLATLAGPTVSGRRITWSGSLAPANLRVDHAIEYEMTDRVAQLHVTLTNTGTGPLTNVHYFVSGNPDHGQCSIGTSYSTNNDVRLQPPTAPAALATATGGAATRLTFGIACLDERARANNGGFGSTAAETAWSAPVDRNGALFDEDIGIVLREPTIPAGGSIEFTYYFLWGANDADIERRLEEALAARVLFVSDSRTDVDIPDALRLDRHRVTVDVDDYVAGDNPALRGPLAGFDAVVWSATGNGTGGAHTNPAVFTNLLSYVMSGGLVLVTGFDAVADPPDPDLVAFLGASGAASASGDPGVVATTRTLLNVGPFDLRGTRPADFAGDLDGLTGLSPGTVAVVDSSSGGAAQWTVRALGSGRIAFVANGDPGPDSEHASWETDGNAYNEALRNFAYAAARGLPAIKSNGEICGFAFECISDHCIDGVCCDSSCGSGSASDCQACSTRNGALANGSCGPLTAAAATRVVCRPAGGGCDFPETCVSTSIECPSDGVRSRGFECRPQIGPCDVADLCDGATGDCPTDAIAAAGMICRDAAGDCDLPEECDGTSPSCPVNAFVGGGETCRASRGICDAQERCDGLGGECPPDRLAGGDVVCRSATHACDAPESCDGTGLECPSDSARDDGVSCDDSLRCNGVDVCMAGACISRGSPCDDGDACTTDLCSEGGGCDNEPIPDCCYDSSQCDDGDACTRDECTREHTCVHDVSALCSDAGRLADAGEATSDGGFARDAGTSPPSSDGCGCSTGGWTPASWSVLVLLALRRRRRD